MPSQIYAPVPVTPGKSSRITGSSDLFASLNATLQSKDNKLATPVRSIQERDWDVPAPPPPSPEGSEVSPDGIFVTGGQ
ncbi:hypothetical protein F5Y17DRAFT_460227 [Xylariaceae sp. FL0594]|nr:hypothetical protein F5Y17DRAFT_460227 [Xylariaceae sp. FL0594]